MMDFNNFKFVVLCDGLFEAGFCTKTEAQNYLADVSKAYPGYKFTLYDMNSGDERELDRIWQSYIAREEEFER